MQTVESVKEMKATEFLVFCNIVRPDEVVIGQKDAQLGVVLKRIARDLCLAVQISLSPTMCWFENGRFPPDRKIMHTLPGLSLDKGKFFPIWGRFFRPGADMSDSSL